MGYQEQEPEQRCVGMKRKYGDSRRAEVTTSAGPALDIPNTSMSISSKEERFKTIKREEEPSSWSCNPDVEFSNSSMSTLSASKEEHSFDEQAMAIKKEDDASYDAS